MYIAIMENMTTVAILRETKDQLAAIGTKGTTFDGIIQELLTYWKEKN